MEDGQWEGSRRFIRCDSGLRGGIPETDAELGNLDIAVIDKSLVVVEL